MKSEYIINKKMQIVLAALMPENRLVAEVALHTGLRISDVLALRRDQVAAGRFWITEQKTGKRRIVALPGHLVQDILAYAGEVWAFPGRYGDKPRTRQAVWRDIKRAARAFRMPENVTPHSCRKIYAVDLMAKYGDIERVRRALNHDRYTTTMLYAMADKLVQADKCKKKRPSTAKRGGKPGHGAT